MSNKVLFGLENVYVAFLTESSMTWGNVQSIPGAVTLGLSPEGAKSTFYADNAAYYVTDANNGYSGSIEFATIPDGILADLLDWHIDINGMLVELSDGVPAPFALLFEVKGDASKKRYVFYKCVAGRPKVEHETQTDKTDPKTVSLDLVVAPIEYNTKWIVKAALERETNTVVFDAWFNAVTLPTTLIS
jgi:phi13 family phage major tail protein